MRFNLAVQRNICSVYGMFYGLRSPRRSTISRAWTNMHFMWQRILLHKIFSSPVNFFPTTMHFCSKHTNRFHMHREPGHAIRTTAESSIGSVKIWSNNVVWGLTRERKTVNDIHSQQRMVIIFYYSKPRRVKFIWRVVRVAFVGFYSSPALCASRQTGDRTSMDFRCRCWLKCNSLVAF